MLLMDVPSKYPMGEDIFHTVIHLKKVSIKHLSEHPSGNTMADTEEGSNDSWIMNKNYKFKRLELCIRQMK